MPALADQTYTIERRQSNLLSPGRVKRRAADTATAYTKIIQALALKFTNTTEEAEAAAREMFDDIYRYSERGTTVRLDEEQLISRIALRRLIKYLK
ncbi:MAG: hypothetical protein IPK01_06455 [Acidobacteria bacterium]|nr:hypothetical protein [Acidobacteriota bacterium]